MTLTLSQDFGFSQNTMDLMQRSGAWIAIVGPDGSGKGTVIENLEFIFNAVVGATNLLPIRYPGGLIETEYLRDKITKGEPEDLTAEAESHLLAINRKINYDNAIKPARDNIAWVLSDRWLPCAYAYQGAGRHLGTERVEEINRYVCNGVADPDFVFILDIDPEVSYSRALESIEKTGDRSRRFEKFGLDLQKNVMQSYREQAERDPHRFHLINASGTPYETACNAGQKLNLLLQSGKIKPDPHLEKPSLASQARVPHTVLRRVHHERPGMRP